jgi:hypothetical protein
MGIYPQDLMKLYFSFILIGLISFWAAPQSIAQEENNDEDVIQFSGVVVDADSLEAVPYTSIIIKNSRRGTLSDFYGYFSFVALKNDTIVFSSMGYKKNFFVIPDSITEKRYSLIHVMNADTIMLSPTVIYPWPTQEEFKKAFVELDIPDDDIAIARKNLARAEMKDRIMNYQMDGSMNYKNYMQNETSKLYYAGQSTPITIFNPFAWAQFIKAWKEGKFKRKKD